MASNNITKSMITDATGRKILEAVKDVSLIPDTRLSVVNNKLCMTFKVFDYDSTKSYDVGDMCVNGGPLLVCTNPTTGTFDSNDWANFFRTYDPDESYEVGDIRVYSNVEYICIEPTTGSFDSSCWDTY